MQSEENILEMSKRRNIPFSPPDITEAEIDAVTKVMRSGWITTGHETKKFEKEIAQYIGVSKAVCLNSATSSLEMTLRILGVGPGDEVITTAYTYTATAAVIHHVGAKIVLVDTSVESYEMDYAILEKLINKNTKAVIAVDVAGKLCDYDLIFDILNNKKTVFEPKNDLQDHIGRVALISDAAHSFGAQANGKKSGQIADFTCFSFHAVKNITTAEGGAVVWADHNKFDNEWLYKQYMLYSLHGQTKDALAKTKIGAWEYDILIPAYKCNMPDIMAAIGRAQLKRIDFIMEKRRRIIERYTGGLKLLPISILQHFGSDYESAGHLFLTRVNGIDEKVRNIIINELSDNGVSCNVHYKPLPLLKAYIDLGFDIKKFPNAYRMYQNEITLPLHPLLSDDEVEYIINVYKSVIGSNR